ncbi:MAG TPA: EamA family transporter [Pseudogracilibacillus sp.]|nr:EamA family transporter [Pseudogracilibacillus sp.]
MLKEPRWIGFVFVIVAAVLWGVGGTVSQFLFQQVAISVEWLVTVRLLISGIILLSIAYFKDRRRTFAIFASRHTMIQLILFSLFGMLAVQYTFFASVALGNAAIATMLQYTAPIFIILYIVISKIDRLHRGEFVAVFGTIIGTFLLLTNGSFSALTVPLTAVIWGLLSGISLAFYTLYASRLMNEWGSLITVGWSMLFASIMMSFIHPPWKVNMTNWTFSAWLMILFIIIFSTMIAFFLYLHSLTYLKPQESSLLATLEPLSAIVTSIIWLHIPFGYFQVLGTLLVLATVVYISVFKKEQRAT